MPGQKIVINDLLSFMSCKMNISSKTKLLKCVKEHYSHRAIQEAHKALSNSLPGMVRIEKTLDSDDRLIDIYECLETTPKQEMPVFVCKDLNNVPAFNPVHTKDGNQLRCFSLKSKYKNKGFKKDNFEKDEDFYRIEQHQMRLKISEMFSIISEITDGLQKFTETRRELLKTHILKVKEETVKPENETTENFNQNVKEIAVESFEENNNHEMISSSTLENHQEPGGEDSERFSENESEKDLSDIDGLALIQKLIDEDDEVNADSVEKDDSMYSDCDPDFDDMPEEEDNTGNINIKEKEPDSVVFNAENDLSETVVTTSDISQEPCLLESQSERASNECSYPEMEKAASSEVENCIEITTSPGFIAEGSEPDHNNSVELPPISVNEENDYGFETEVETSPKKRGNTYECHYCMEIFTSYKKLRKHTSAHYVVKSSHECVLCRLKLSNREELRTHFKSCFEENKDNHKDNICTICKTYYASDKAMKQHSNLHEEFRPHACPHCPYRYLNKARLETHIKNQHSPLRKLFCPFCPHAAITNAYLNKHLKVHTGEAPFLCKVCGHQSKTKFQLKRHIELHGPLRERKCDKCNFVCIGLNQYLRHRRKQHNKPIICQICKQAFKQSEAFVRHFSMHTKKKPYKCDYCLYTATAKETLRLHKLTHMGANAQQCPNCNVLCRTKRNLRRHLEAYCITLETTDKEAS